MNTFWYLFIILQLYTLSTQACFTNSACKFPFIYEGITYNQCTTKDYDSAWCATETDDRNNYVEGQWTDCNEKCPGCRLWMCDAPEQHAMLVHSNGTGILYPDVVEESWSSGNGDTDGGGSSGTVCKSRDHFKAIDIPDGDVIAACPGFENKLRNFENSSLTLTCHNGRLMNNGKDIHWSDLGCLHKLRSATKRRVSGVKCGAQQGYIQTIGWRINKKFFIPQIEICFNKDLQTTLYTKHFIHGRYIDAKAVDPKPRRPGFSRGKLFTANVNNLYKKKNQKLVLAKLLGAPDHLAEFGLKQNYLARGHLSPDADFVTEAEQNATFSYGNAVPQWQGFNNGNWKKLEDATRDLAETSQQTLSIWTGTHGVLHLPDDQGNAVPVYLGLLEDQKIVPVPELMWKVIYNPSEDQSVVIIGLNDISGKEISDSSSSALCQDICSSIEWVKWKEINIASKGKMMCCSLHDAKRVIPTLPQLDDTSLLR